MSNFEFRLQLNATGAIYAIAKWLLDNGMRSVCARLCAFRSKNEGEISVCTSRGEQRAMSNFEFLTAAEPAERLRGRPAAIRRWRRQGVIPAVQISRKVIRYDYQAVVRELSGEPFGGAKARAPPAGLWAGCWNRWEVDLTVCFVERFMDVSNYLGGRFLTHGDLVVPSQTWTIGGVSLQLIGSDQRIVVQFHQHPKPLVLNKTNLQTIAAGYGVQADAWVGRPLDVYRDQTLFQGQQRGCIRVRIPAGTLQQPTPSPSSGQVPPQQFVSPPSTVAAAVQPPASQQQQLAGSPWVQ